MIRIKGSVKPLFTRLAKGLTLIARQVQVVKWFDVGKSKLQLVHWVSKVPVVVP